MNQDKRQLAAFEEAKDYIGLKEIKGPTHEKIIVDFFEVVGHGWVKDDETAWCGAFLGAMLAEQGLPLPALEKRLTARAYLDIGEPVELEDAKPGDIVVFWRGSPDGWQGHTGFFVKRDGNGIFVLGGNTSDSVAVDVYPVSRLLGVRRFRGPETQEKPMNRNASLGLFAFVVFAVVLYMIVGR